MQILCLRKAILPSSHWSPACSPTLSGTRGRGARVLVLDRRGRLCGLISGCLCDLGQVVSFSGVSLSFSEKLGKILSFSTASWLRGYRVIPVCLSCSTYGSVHSTQGRALFPAETQAPPAPSRCPLSLCRMNG